MPTDEAARERGRRWLAAGFDVGTYAGERSSKGCLMHQVDRFTGHWPDDRDPATLGVMVAQTRERWGLPTAHSGHMPDVRWAVVSGTDDQRNLSGDHATEAAAWLAAFEAGPREPKP